MSSRYDDNESTKHSECPEGSFSEVPVLDFYRGVTCWTWLFHVELLALNGLPNFRVLTAFAPFTLIVQLEGAVEGEIGLL